MPRQTTAIGREALISREAIKLVAYLDSVKVWTIGIGHTAAAGAPIPVAGMKITKAEALAIFYRDIVAYEDYVIRSLGEAIANKLEDHQFDALVSICFNLGPKWFIGKKKASFITAILKGDMQAAAKNIMNFTSPKEVTTRRKAEQMQFETPYSVSLPKGRSTDPKPIKMPKDTVPTLAPKVTERPVAAIAGTLGNLFNTVLGRAPNVTDAKTFPPGFKGDPLIGSIQAELRRKGYTEVGKIDGFLGPDTRKALELSIMDNEGLKASASINKFNQTTLDFVNKIPNRPVALDRAISTTADVQNAAPEVMAPVNNLIKIGLTTVGMGGLAGVGDYIEQAKEAADKAHDTYLAAKPLLDFLAPILTFVAKHPAIVLTSVGIICLLLVAGNVAAIVQMFRYKRIN